MSSNNLAPYLAGFLVLQQQFEKMNRQLGQLTDALKAAQPKPRGRKPKAGTVVKEEEEPKPPEGPIMRLIRRSTEQAGQVFDPTLHKGTKVIDKGLTAVGSKMTAVTKSLVKFGPAAILGKAALDALSDVMSGLQGPFQSSHKILKAIGSTLSVVLLPLVNDINAMLLDILTRTGNAGAVFTSLPIWTTWFVNSGERMRSSAERAGNALSTLGSNLSNVTTDVTEVDLSPISDAVTDLNGLSLDLSGPRGQILSTANTFQEINWDGIKANIQTQSYNALVNGGVYMGNVIIDSISGVIVSRGRELGESLINAAKAAFWATVLPSAGSGSGARLVERE